MRRAHDPRQKPLLDNCSTTDTYLPLPLRHSLTDCPTQRSVAHLWRTSRSCMNDMNEAPQRLVLTPRSHPASVATPCAPSPSPPSADGENPTEAAHVG